jgi:hypothetical protein
MLGFNAITYAQGIGSECVPEIKAYCLDRAPGGDRIECLKENRDKASRACKKFIKALSK